MKTAKCKACNHEISLILSPFESFEKQQTRIYNGYCSKLCADKKLRLKTKIYHVEPHHCNTCEKEN